ncbi:PPOX class F420-dependent oxidoreductase [Mycolicibacterium novocastrense]|uniref:CtcM n=1 Tax=Mycolicibacterium novocastrense TaxID=59813 RepID=A0AAW5SLT5_MYCNV|nr:PPOX class F420-dependent oxidoreductase [Mycolicibacterium novocastrense]MCV7024411.1 PPOX class F420-dependent oxidoreductase [Mycolicibacterium novocastrense]GAT12931.1 CtcM [Mycolicibacterium novocastrense]
MTDRQAIAFTDKEIAYLNAQQLGRLATVDSHGHPHVVPTGFHLDVGKSVLEIGAHNLPDRGQRRLYFRHIAADPYVAFVVDDVATEPDWTPRGVAVRGKAHIHEEGGERLAPGFGPRWVEIVPETISSWGIDTTPYEPPNFRRLDNR